MHTVEVAAHCAWDEYYNQMVQKIKCPRGRGVTLYASRYFKTFMQIAEWCTQRGYDTRDFVTSVLELLQKDPNYLTPKDLYKPGILALYTAAVERRNNASSIQLAWDSQERVVRQMRAQRPDLFTDAYSIFSSSWKPFESWFRIAYPEEPDARLVTMYGHDAWTELQTTPALRVFLSNVRPKTLRLLQEQYGYFGDIPVGSTT